MTEKIGSIGLELKIRFSKIPARQLEKLHKVLDSRTCYVSKIEGCTNTEMIISKQGNRGVIKEEKLGQSYTGVEATITDSVNFNIFYKLTKIMYSALLGPRFEEKEVEEIIKENYRKVLKSGH